MLLRPNLPLPLPLPMELQEHLSVLRGRLDELHKASAAYLGHKSGGNLATLEKLQEQAFHNVHACFKGLWMQEWTDSEEVPFADPTMVFVALLNLRKDGSFGDVEAVTKPLSAMTYVLRCMFKMEIIAQGKSSGEAHSAVLARLAKWFTEKEHSPFNGLRSLMHRASSIIFNTVKPPDSFWIDRETWKILKFQGDRIDFDNVRTMFGAMQDKALSLWEKDVCMGAPIRVHYTELHDDPSNKEVGYSFLSANAAFQDKDMLLRHFMSQPELAQKLVVIDAYGGHEWNVPALHAWLLKLEELELLSLTLTEFLMGGPARGTELEAMKYKNTTTRQRNLFCHDKYMAVVRMYTKTNALSGRDKMIPCALDAFLANLTVQILHVARPFAILASSVCFPGSQEVVQIYGSQMWCGYGRRFKTDNVSVCMKDYSVVHVGCEIQTRKWRQLSTIIRRKRTKAAFDFYETEQEMNTLDAVSMGHSRSTDISIYGITTDSLVGAEDILPLLLDMSCVWQDNCLVARGELGFVKMSRTQD
jgi:hypothetical protein